MTSLAAYRDNEFLPFMHEMEARMSYYSGANMDVVEPPINSDMPPMCHITHDESSFYANDGQNTLWFWGRETEAAS